MFQWPEKQIVKQTNPQRSRHRLLHLHVSLWREPHNVPRCKWILVFVVSNIIIGVYIYSSTEIDLTFRQLGYEGGRITFAGTDRVKHCGIKINAIEEKDNGEWKWVRIQTLFLFIATSSPSLSPHRVGIKLHIFLFLVNILVLLVIIKTKVMRNWVDRVEN